MKADTTLTPQQVPEDADLRPVDARQLWQWVAPWLGGALLVAAGLLGLFTASRAQDGTAYALGFVTAGLAVLALAWRIRAHFDQQEDGALLPVLVDEAGSLMVLIMLLAALAIAGLVLAARTGDTGAASAGYALFAVGVVLIFLNLKHHFDRQESRARE